MPRLATCMYCRTIERMPDPPAGVRLVPARWATMDGNTEREHFFKDDDGNTIMVPEFDPLLEDYVGRHGHGMVDTASINYIKVFPVDPETYARVDVVTALKKELEQQTGEFYEESLYYKEEAVKCYNAHGNPTTQNRCSDFCDESKRIGSGDVPKKHQVFLCHMCPYMQSQIAQEMRWRAGLYSPEAIRSASARRRRRRQR